MPSCPVCSKRVRMIESFGTAFICRNCKSKLLIRPRETCVGYLLAIVPMLFLLYVSSLPVSGRRVELPSELIFFFVAFWSLSWMLYWWRRVVVLIRAADYSSYHNTMVRLFNLTMVFLFLYFLLWKSLKLW